MIITSAQDVLDSLNTEGARNAVPLWLATGGTALKVMCPEPLRSRLARYFAHVLCHDAALCEESAALLPPVLLLPQQTLPPETASAFTDWAREPGKTGRKDAIADLRDGRLIQKVRSGVTFLQSPHALAAFGDLEAHESTVINFINTQFLNVALRAGWQICHAAAATNGTRSIAIAGLSGGGKSTTMLRLMDLPGVRFVSNDRLMVRAGTPPQAQGIPKHPRINPGTILGNPRLHPLLSEARLAQLNAMNKELLWTLEEKHDLVIPEIYGAGRIEHRAPLTDVWILNWSRESHASTELRPATLDTRPDLLGALMKSAGPFYQDANGTFLPNGADPQPEGYLAALAGANVWEATGEVDFDALARAGRDVLAG